ncbi:MAG: class I SAM-dependent methyltransferase [Selenomonadaceae bacterium]|nr:class I SAM-dependent methyltransferase [Selenomonadaceae bacterium]
MQNFIVTTARKSKADSGILAETFARNLNLKFVPRADFSLDALKKIYRVENILLIRNNFPVIVTNEGEIFFHPNTAHLRIKNLRQGLGDRLIDAAKIQAGDKILDCTLGLGSDSIVLSFVSENVTALEINPVLAEVVRYGMKNFSDDTPPVIDAMRRVEIVTADYFDYLKNCAENSFDVVYFDPMFRHGIIKSSGINPIRPLADNRPLEIDSVREACRVARRCVVMKENSRSSEFARLGFKIAGGGKYSSISFGVIDS